MIKRAVDKMVEFCPDQMVGHETSKGTLILKGPNSPRLGTHLEVHLRTDAAKADELKAWLEELLHVVGEETAERHKLHSKWTHLGGSYGHPSSAHPDEVFGDLQQLVP